MEIMKEGFKAWMLLILALVWKLIMIATFILVAWKVVEFVLGVLVSIFGTQEESNEQA